MTSSPRPGPARIASSLLWLGILAGCGIALSQLGGSAAQSWPARIPMAANDRVREIPIRASQPWSVLVLADVQDGFPYLSEIFRRAASAHPLAVIILGDLARRADANHRLLIARELHRHPAPAPLFAVPGNHDCDDAADAADFAAHFGATEFDFRIGRTRFLGIDSACPRTPAEQQASAARLRRQLRAAAARDEHVVLLRHHPLRQAGEPTPHRADADVPLQEIQRLASLPLVLTGHEHAHAQDRVGETTLVVAPSSGDLNSGESAKPVSYLLLRWTGERLALEVERFPRENWRDLRAQTIHLTRAHVSPLLDDLVRSWREAGW
jgi:predicted phosphodiesterase